MVNEYHGGTWHHDGKAVIATLECCAYQCYLFVQIIEKHGVAMP